MAWASFTPKHITVTILIFEYLFFSSFYCHTFIFSRNLRVKLSAVFVNRHRTAPIFLENMIILKPLKIHTEL